MKKILILIILLLAAIITMAYFYFSALSAEKKNSDGSLYAAAHHSALVMCFQNDQRIIEILSEQKVLQEVLGKQKYSELEQLQTVLKRSPVIATALNKQNTYIGVQADKKDIRFIFATQFNNEISIKQIFSALQSISKVSPQEEIYKLAFGDTSTYFLGTRQNILIVGKNANDVKASLSASPDRENGFASHIKASSRISKNSLAELHIDFNNLPEILKATMPGNLNGQLKPLDNLDAYTVLSYNYSSGKLLLNGSTQLNDSESYFSLFSHKPQKVTITNMLPDNTANYTVFTIPLYKPWEEDLAKWFERNEKPKFRQNLIEDIQEEYHLDMNQVFPQYFKSQIITFQLSTSEKLAAIDLTNGEKLNQLLLDLSTEYSDEIRSFKERNLLYAYFGEPFKEFSKPYFTIVDNFLVFASYPSTVKSFLNSYKANRLLNNSNTYIAAAGQLPENASIMYFADFRNSSRLMLKNIYLPFYRHLQQESMDDFTSFIWQMSGENGKFQTDVLLTKKPEEPDDDLESSDANN